MTLLVSGPARVSAVLTEVFVVFLTPLGAPWPLPSSRYVMVKVKLSLCLSKHHAVKTYGGAEVLLPTLTSVLDGGEWSTSHPGRFTPSTHCMVDWVGPSAVLDAVSKSPCPYRKYNLGTPARRLITILTELSWLLPPCSAEVKNAWSCASTPRMSTWCGA